MARDADGRPVGRRVIVDDRRDALFVARVRPGAVSDHDPDAAEVATADLGGVRIVVTHGTGPDAGYEKRVAAVVDDHAAADRPTVGVSGHTHSLLDTRVDGYRLLNPGSATGAWPANEATLMEARVEDGALDVEVRRA